MTARRWGTLCARQCGRARPGRIQGAQHADCTARACLRLEGALVLGALGPRTDEHAARRVAANTHGLALSCHTCLYACVGACLAAVLQAFKQLDKDGSGTISMDELTEACR